MLLTSQASGWAGNLPHALLVQTSASMDSSGCGAEQWVGVRQPEQGQGCKGGDGTGEARAQEVSQLAMGSREVLVTFLFCTKMSPQSSHGGKRGTS